MDAFWDTAARERAEEKLRNLTWTPGDVDTFVAQFRTLADQAQYPLNDRPTISLFAGKLPYKMMSFIFMNVKHKSLKIPTLLQSSQRKAEKQVLVDSGATDNFISTKILKHMKIGSLRLKKPRTVWNIDGTHNKAGAITDFVDLQVRCGSKTEDMKFLVTDLGEDEITLGCPWLAPFQPDIDWKESVLVEDVHPLVIKTLGLKMDEEV